MLSIQDAPPGCRAASLTLYALQCLRATGMFASASKLKGHAARTLALKQSVLRWQTREKYLNPRGQSNEECPHLPLPCLTV